MQNRDNKCNKTKFLNNKNQDKDFLKVFNRDFIKEATFSRDQEVQTYKKDNPRYCSYRQVNGMQYTVLVRYAKRVVERWIYCK
jgi:hypothetical protein